MFVDDGQLLVMRSRMGSVELEVRDASSPDTTIWSKEIRNIVGPQLIAHIDAFDADVEGLQITRYHGDLHLGQILIVKDDFVIIDFEGGPQQSIEERRRKHCPLRGRV